MNYISKAKLEILYHLNTYRFLTSEHVVSLGVTKSIVRARTLLRELSADKRPLAKFIKYDGIGSPNLYFLTKKGADFISEEFGIEATNYPRRQDNVTSSHIHHHILTVDFHIKAVQTFGNTIDFFDAYFQYSGGNRTAQKLRKKVRVDLEEGFIEPDAIFGVTSPEKKYLFALEIERGADKKKALRKMKLHFDALKQMAIAKKYQFDRHWRVLWVFEEQGLMNAVMKEMRESGDYEKAKPLFCFKTAKDVQADFLHWGLFDDSRVLIV